MSDNDTSALNSTCANCSSSPDIRRLTPVQCVTIAVFALSAITFVIGICSWILIKKFRHFKNYLFLNIIFNNVLNIVLGYFVGDVLNDYSTAEIKYVYGLSYIFLKMSVHYWLLVLCYTFYIDLVIVFDGEFKKKYLKSTLFAWGLPLILIVFDVFVLPHLNSLTKNSAIVYVVNYFSPLVINLFIYLRVLYALCISDVHNTNDRCRRFQVATAIFLISGTHFLVIPLRLKLKFPKCLSTVLVYLQPVVMDLYFFAVRLNRTVWKKYYDGKIKSALIPLNIK